MFALQFIAFALLASASAALLRLLWLADQSTAQMEVAPAEAPAQRKRKRSAVALHRAA